MRARTVTKTSAPAVDPGTGGGQAPAASVIVATYRQPVWLERVLLGYALQDAPSFEVVVADDGSGPLTADVVRRTAAATGLALAHVWHEDRGFRKTEILNRAVLEAKADYLIFSDGDCVPRSDFVATHLELAEPGRFLSGGYVRLPADVSRNLSSEDVGSGRAFGAGWLRAQGSSLGRRRLRLLRPGLVPRLLDAVTPTGATWNGMNASTWKEHVLAVNGFDLELTYGGLDREFGARLENMGLAGKGVRHRTVLLHLHHERPYRIPDTVARQRRLRREVRSTGRVRAPLGLAELPQGVAHRVVRWDGGRQSLAEGPMTGEAPPGNGARTVAATPGRGR